jgi:hypothetical protein
MSVNKFKIGDKVRVREGASPGSYYNNMYCGIDMAKPGSEVSTVVFAGRNIYKLEGCDSWWTDEMLELAEKTLYNLEKGDIVSFDNNNEKRTVLAAIDNCYLLSYPNNFTSASFWYTVDDLKYYECTVQQSEIETINIDGKKYNKNEVEEAIKDLEPIE